MLQGTLLAMKDSLLQLNDNKILVTNNDILNIIAYFEKWKNGDFIFPMKFMDEVEISIEKVYDILTKLEDDKFIEPIFQIYCYKCNNFQKGYYLTLVEIPDEELCEFCHEEINENNIVVRYRITKD